MINLERVPDEGVIARNFKRLAKLVMDTGGVGAGIRWGTDTVTFTASNTSATRTIAHGLGRTPANIQLTSYNNLLPQIVSKDATNIQFLGYHVPGTSISGTFNVDWQVIG